jgi:hypothetical protein
MGCLHGCVALVGPIGPSAVLIIWIGQWYTFGWQSPLQAVDRYEPVTAASRTPVRWRGTSSDVSADREVFVRAREHWRALNKGSE